MAGKKTLLSLWKKKKKTTNQNTARLFQVRKSKGKKIQRGLTILSSSEDITAEHLQNQALQTRRSNFIKTLT